MGFCGVFSPHLVMTAFTSTFLLLLDLVFGVLHVVPSIDKGEDTGSLEQ